MPVLPDNEKNHFLTIILVMRIPQMKSEQNRDEFVEALMPANKAQ